MSMNVWPLAAYCLVGLLSACASWHRPPVSLEKPLGCLARHSSDSVGRQLRIDGPPFRRGDRVVVIVDDSVRGVVRVVAESPVKFDPATILDSVVAHEVAELTVIKAQEARQRAVPCEVEGGIVVRTVRSSP